MNAEVARRVIRFVTYYLIFFVVTNLVRERQQLNFLLNGFFLLATLVAVVMVAQFLLGRSITILPGRIEALDTQGVAYADITRILPPGLSIVLVSFVTTFCILLFEKFKSFVWLKFFQFGLLGMAFLFTFLRSYFGALIIVFSLLGFILRGRDRQKLINWSLAIIFVAVLTLILVSIIPDSRVAGLADASTQRLGTVFKIETYQGQDSSLNWRAIENGYALRQITSHPLLGLGVGSTYRPFDVRLDQGDIDMRDFIHNGHLRILMDSGLLGYLAFMGLSLAFVMRGLRNWRLVTDDRLRGVVLGFTLVYMVIFIAAVVNSTFEHWNWTPVIGIMMGVNEVILLKFWQGKSAV